MTILELNNTSIYMSKSKIDSGTCPIVVDNFHRYLILVYIIYRRCRVFYARYCKMMNRMLEGNANCSWSHKSYHLLIHAFIKPPLLESKIRIRIRSNGPWFVPWLQASIRFTGGSMQR